MRTASRSFERAVLTATAHSAPMTPMMRKTMSHSTTVERWISIMCLRNIAHRETNGHTHARTDFIECGSQIRRIDDAGPGIAQVRIEVERLRKILGDLR